MKESEPDPNDKDLEEIEHAIQEASDNVNAIIDRDLLDEMFFDLFGVTLNWARQMAKMENELGEHWRSVFREIKRKYSEEDPSEKTAP